MLADKLNMFSDDQAVTATAQGTTPIDLTIARNIADGNPPFLQVFSTEAATASGSATVTISVITGDTVDGNNDIETPTTVYTGATIGKAAITAGKLLENIALPANVSYGKYINVLYTVATGPLTAGKFDALLTPAPLGKRNAPAEV